MRAPLSWIRHYVAIPSDQTGPDVAARLISAGLEVERVDVLGAEVTFRHALNALLGHLRALATDPSILPEPT